MAIYVNNKLTYVVNAAKMNTTLSLAAGKYSTTVEEWDHCGGASYTKIAVMVGGGGKTGVTVTASLSLGNVNSKTFGKLFSYLLDGYAYAEPLLMSNVTIKGATHNVVYVATERDSVYAFDANSYGSGTPLWQVSLLQSGETPLTGSTVLPNQGITSTPVIDPSSNTIYVVSIQKSSASGSTFRLNALDITTGAQKFGGPVTIHASVPGTNSAAVNGVVSLPSSCIQRAALLLTNGNVYLGFGSCHSGWLLGYDARTLAQTAVFNASPNLNGEGTYTAPAGIRQFVYSGKLTYGAETKPSILTGTRGTTPFISADGTANGILWMIDAGQPLQTSSTPTSSTLRAYDANDLGTELYDSGQNAADVPGFGIKFSSPIVATIGSTRFCQFSRSAFSCLRPSAVRR